VSRVPGNPAGSCEAVHEKARIHGELAEGIHPLVVCRRVASVMVSKIHEDVSRVPGHADVNEPISLDVKPLDTESTFRSKAYDALRAAIAAMNIYDSTEDIRLDERRLVQELGVSRTPIREALVRLEQDGIVRSIPRRGVFVVRKTRREIVQIITVWAALESLAARLATVSASDDEIGSLHDFFNTFEASELATHVDEYSDANLAFHQRILEISHCDALYETAATLFVHMRAIRHKTISENRRFEISIKEHLRIIDALAARDADTAERLVREHALDLAKHVEKNAHYLA
jgi:DNA-binding GntR family transcriptional regulator